MVAPASFEPTLKNKKSPAVAEAKSNEVELAVNPNVPKVAP